MTGLPRLASNKYLGHKGFQLNGDGFIVNSKQKDTILRNKGFGKKYFIGSDLNTRDRGFYALDFFDLSEEEVRQKEPNAYQHLLVHVKKQRESNPIDYRRINWWLFGQPSTELRDATEGLKKFIATPRQGKFRLFLFVPENSIVESTNVVIAVDEAWILAVLTSKTHECFSLKAGGWMGVGNDPRYFHTTTFNPFPFPDASPEQKQRIGALAEELDAVRKQVLEAHADLTLTGLYNLRDKVRKGEPMDIIEQDQRQRGLIDLICELHDRIDDAVADAYGWPRDLSDEEIVARLVALNAERHAEEQRGIVRWLRPEYQIPKAGVIELKKPEPGTQIEALLPEAGARKPLFPRDAIGQTAAVIDGLRAGAMDAEAIARRFSQGMKVGKRVQATLDALERLGHVHRSDAGYALRKVA